MALWNELVVFSLRIFLYIVSLRGFGGYSRYVLEEMINSLDIFSIVLFLEIFLFSVIKKCISLNCIDNISWFLCSCYRLYIYIIFSIVNDIF